MFAVILSFVLRFLQRSRFLILRRRISARFRTQKFHRLMDPICGPESVLILPLHGWPLRVSRPALRPQNEGRQAARFPVPLGMCQRMGAQEGSRSREECGSVVPTRKTSPAVGTGFAVVLKLSDLTLSRVQLILACVFQLRVLSIVSGCSDLSV